MKKLLKSSNTDSVLALLLFAVFAVCILSVLLTGADSFRRLSSRDRESFDRRTAAQYIATRVRQADGSGRIALCDFEGVTALTCTEFYDGEPYLTRVYFYDGYIRELFCSADAALRPEDGEKILRAAGLSFSEERGVITAAVTDAAGEIFHVCVSPRSGGEGIS